MFKTNYWNKLQYLLQVEKAYDFLSKFSKEQETKWSFGVSVGDNKRGIYIREPHQFSKPQETNVTIEPSFNNSKTEQTEKISFNMRFCMTCDADWVTHPQHLELMNVSRSFSVKVDTSGLSEGVHYTEVCFCWSAFRLVIISLATIFRLRLMGKCIISFSFMNEVWYHRAMTDLLYCPHKVKCELELKLYYHCVESAYLLIIEKFWWSLLERGKKEHFKQCFHGIKKNWIIIYLPTAMLAKT